MRSLKAVRTGEDDDRAVPLAPTLAACGLAPRHALPALAALGFRHVQLSATQEGMRPRELDRSARRDVQAALRRNGLELAGLDCWIPPGHFLDPVRSDRAIGALVAAVELAASWGGCPVSATLPGEGAEAVWETVRAAAAERETAVALHVVVDDAVGFDRWLGLGIDPAMWLAAGRDPAAAVTAHGGDLKAARLADVGTSGDRIPLGASGGRLDALAYRAAIGAVGFAGPVVLDSRGWPEPLRGIEQTLGAWRDTIGPGG